MVRAKASKTSPRFDNAEFNALYQQQVSMPDGPERLAVMQQAAKIMVAYMPIKVELQPGVYRHVAALADRLYPPSDGPRPVFGGMWILI